MKTRKFILRLIALTLRVPAFYMCLTGFEKLGYGIISSALITLLIVFAFDFGTILGRED